MGKRNTSLFQSLQEILRGNPSAKKEILDSFRPINPEQEQSESDLWIDYLDCILLEFPIDYSGYTHLSSGFSFELTGLYEGFVTGNCKYGSQRYRLFVDLDDENVSVGCTCERSQGEKPCPHGYLFTRWLKQNLRSGAIQSRVNKGAFDKNPPSPESFKPDAVARYRNYLKEVNSNLKRLSASQAAPLDALEVETKEVGRVGWNFYNNRSGQLTVVPMFQTPKKRGNAWTKGKKISFLDLNNYAYCMAPHDQRIRDKIKISDQRYELQYELNPIDAAMELMGHDNALYEGNPTAVHPLDLRVELATNAEKCTLLLKATDADNLYSVKKGVIGINKEGDKIMFCEMTPEQLECVKLVHDLPDLPIALKDDVIAIAQSVQQHLTVDLPKEIAGEQVADPATPLLLLMVDAQANLNYGCRVRLNSARIAIPGQGSLTRADKRDGKPIQLVRNHKDETQMWSVLCEKLELPSLKMQGSISGFDAVMACLQKVRELEGGDTKLEVLWDPKSEKPIRMLGNITPSSLRVSVKKSRDWLQLSGECDFGDSKMDLATLLRNLRSLDAGSIQGNYVRLGDHGWAKISDALRKQLNKLDDSVNEDRKNLVFDASSAKVIQELSAQQIQIDGSSAWTQCLERMERARNITPELPMNLNAQLRDYQLEGYCWMRRLAEWGVGGVLADDMGLGKTLQTLAVLLDRSSKGPALVIAPTSVGFNWIREAEKFTPDLKAHLYRETDRDDFLANVGPGDLVVSSYGLILRDAEKLAKIEWGTLVLDEAQAVKNARSKTATAIADLKADWKVALTGTPVENHLGELWSLFRSISPGVFGGWEQFRKRFAGPIEKDDDADRRMALRERIQPFVLRRTKAEVLKDLPARSEMNQYIDLSPEEREVYNRVRLSVVGELDEIAKLSDIQDQRFKMLALLTRLRQLACSPKLVHADWPGRSSKLQHLAETLQELRSEGHRTLVFSQFVTHLDLIQQMLTEEGISFQYLDGSTSPKDRQKRVDDFQAGNGDVFLISLKAGGTGLNLTAADYVIHTDPWWNPAVEDQATDRAHRIGQDKPVMVYRLISKGTIEEEILKLHDSKRDLVAGILEGSHSAGKLSTQDLMALIRG
ncbi:MAG: DEAD/DEAH box helicase [Pirellulales bacterium]